LEFLGIAVGSEGDLGALGVVIVAFSGFDSPTSFVRYIVTAYLLPAILALSGSSKTTFVPITSPSSAFDFEIPKDLP
jgi:hypothetical protein